MLIRLFLPLLLALPTSAYAIEFKRAFFPRQDRLYTLDGDTACYRRRPERRETVCWRVLGIDAPELHKACSKAIALKAKDELGRLLSLGKPLVWVSRKPDKYGRPLVKITVGKVDVAKSMVTNGFARPYLGGKRTNWCSASISKN